MIDQISWIIFSIPALLIASSVHEFAHAWSAYKLGDLTAKLEGRLTLNPLAHIDIVGALMMVFARFGWSKPVPINEYNFKNPVTGTALTALAGPVSNIFLAALTAILFRFLFPEFIATGIIAEGFQTYAAMILLVFIMVNLSLGVFNLLPIPPLDGHKIVRALLPKSIRHVWEGMERYGIWILLLLFLPISPLSYVTATFLSAAIGWFLGILL